MSVWRVVGYYGNNRQEFTLYVEADSTEEAIEAAGEIIPGGDNAVCTDCSRTEDIGDCGHG
jgi:hypothetical protein